MTDQRSHHPGFPSSGGLIWAPTNHPTTPSPVNPSIVMISTPTPALGMVAADAFHPATPYPANFIQQGTTINTLNPSSTFMSPTPSTQTFSAASNGPCPNDGSPIPLSGSIPGAPNDTCPNDAIDISSSYQPSISADEIEIEEACPDSPTTAAKKKKVDVTIKYCVYMEKIFDASINSARYVKVVPYGPIDPMTCNIRAWPWSDFKRQIMCHLSLRPKLMDLLERLEGEKKLIWIGYIHNNRLFPKRARTTIEGDWQFKRFADEAFKSRPSEVTIEITMKDPKASEKTRKTAAEVDNLLNLEFGTNEEQESARRIQTRKQANPRAEEATALQQMVATVYRSCLEHSEKSLEGLTFVNPDNRAQYMHIGHDRLAMWAKAIIEGTPGVDPTHPPKTPDFQWLQTPGTLPNVASVPDSSPDPHTSPVPSAPAPPPVSSSSVSGIPSNSSGETHVNTIPPQFAHFNNDKTPLPQSRVEHFGSMTQFLGCSRIPFDDHHTRILIEHHRIHHWSYFRRATMVELLGMGFSPGPARLLIDGVPYFKHVLLTTPEDPDFGDL